MKSIGHVSTAIIAATPLIYFRSHFPAWTEAESLSTYELLWLCGVFAIFPDLDIILQKYLPVKHRGYFSHSIWSALTPGVLICVLWYFSGKGDIPKFKYFTPYAGMLASCSIFFHLIGDSITKTGVPLFFPKKPWHFPFIGGYAAFDNYFLNLIPMVTATWIVGNVFGYNPALIKGLGKFKDVTKLFIGTAEDAKETAEDATDIK